ncbi:nuclear transport factor 2 family protein [Flagellimonas sp. S174]|uniref:nuclear transport factor 2 family protein n=1 Tax=Flagellimonas sp. S174 TaxID=3410790 RepID=UPI003BF5C2BE
MKNMTLVLLLFASASFTYAQTELESINKVLYDYIEGTANGEPERLREAFDEDFNLYFVRNDSLQKWPGKNYINNVKPGQKSNRIGRVLSIDFEGDAASAKVEILMPGLKRIYTDYFLLLKVDQKWKIIHKTFTFKNYPK